MVCLLGGKCKYLFFVLQSTTQLLVLYAFMYLPCVALRQVCYPAFHLKGKVRNPKRQLHNLRCQLQVCVEKL